MKAKSLGFMIIVKTFTIIEVVEYTSLPDNVVIKSRFQRFFFLLFMFLNFFQRFLTAGCLTNNK